METTFAAPFKRLVRLSRLSQMVQLGLTTALHGAALFLSLVSLQERPDLAASNFVPLLIAITYCLSVLLVFTPDRLGVRISVLLAKTLFLQLALIPLAFPTSMKTLLVAALVMETVVALKRPVNLILALGFLALLLLGQGDRILWGQPVKAAGIEELTGVGLVSFMVLVLSFTFQTSISRLHSSQTELKHVQEALLQIVQANVGLQELAVEVEQASMERERQRITREIHDIVGYTLTNQTMALQAALVLLEKDKKKLRDLLEEAQEASRNGLQEVRQALHQLRFQSLTSQGFLNRILKLCRTFENATKVRVELFGPQTPDSLPPALEVVIYRMIQEGLTNSFLHGKASRVSVHLYFDEGNFVVWIADNGVGSKIVQEGIGLAGMRERLLPFGGSLEYTGTSDGFHVKALVPKISEEKT